jgi:hypothetical protein
MDPDGFRLLAHAPMRESLAAVWTSTISAPIRLASKKLRANCRRRAARGMRFSDPFRAKAFPCSLAA